MNFQAELKQNLRTPEEVRIEKMKQENDLMDMKVREVLRSIKEGLICEVKCGAARQRNGLTVVSCETSLNSYFTKDYISHEEISNIDEIAQDQKRLIKDPNLIYRTWDYFEVSKSKQNEFKKFVAELKRQAAAENIKVEVGAYAFHEKRFYALPAKIPHKYTHGYAGCVRAMTIITSGEITSQMWSQLEFPKAIQTVNVSDEKQETTAQKEKRSATNTMVRFMIAFILAFVGIMLCAVDGISYINLLAMVNNFYLGYMLIKT